MVFLVRCVDFVLPDVLVFWWGFSLTYYLLYMYDFEGSFPFEILIFFLITLYPSVFQFHILVLVFFRYNILIYFFLGKNCVVCSFSVHQSWVADSVSVYSFVCLVVFFIVIYNYVYSLH